MSILNKMLYPVELVSTKHEKFINKNKSEIMFPGRTFFKILSKEEVKYKLELLRPNDYSKINCYVSNKNMKYGYAIDNDKLVTIFYTKDRYLNGVIDSAIINGARSFIYNIEACSINKNNEMMYNKLIKKGLKPKYE